MIGVFICVCLFPPEGNVMNMSKSDGMCSRSLRAPAKMVLETIYSPFPRQALCLMDNQHLPSSNHFGRSFSLKISKHSSLHLYDAFIVT
jgi:hypothetical protein